MKGTFEKDKSITTVSEQYERLANNALKVMRDYVNVDEYYIVGDRAIHMSEEQITRWLTFLAAQANTYATLALAAATAEAVKQP